MEWHGQLYTIEVDGERNNDAAKHQGLHRFLARRPYRRLTNDEEASARRPRPAGSTF
ncbi:hypothetical protein [Nocardia brasiliensis]|uniref:hypothetical protein n=1 Tax=Nocardia brasiliensis TaxID=37326 RepID=UPI00031E67CD|nr:hypothetical protein [Nocardia brasiliensis]